MNESDNIEQVEKSPEQALLPVNNVQLVEQDLARISVMTVYNGETYQVEEATIADINRDRTGSDSATFERFQDERPQSFSSIYNDEDNVIIGRIEQALSVIERDKNNSSDEDDQDGNQDNIIIGQQNPTALKRSNRNLEQLLYEIRHAFEQQNQD